MAKQTFTTGQVLTAAQMTSLQQTAMGGGSATAKTASYTLVAADAGTTVIMNSGSATTITVNTGLFAAGDTVFIVNQGAGVCTISGGTATVSTAGSLAMGANETGQLYFLSASAAIFSEYTQTAGGGGKVLQVVQATYATSTATTSTSFVDSGLSASITPSAASSKIMVIATLPMKGAATVGGDIQGGFQLVRGATAIQAVPYAFSVYLGASQWKFMQTLSYLDSPSTTSATTYKIQITALGGSSSTITAQSESNTSVILLLEIGA